MVPFFESWLNPFSDRKGTMVRSIGDEERSKRDGSRWGFGWCCLRRHADRKLRDSSTRATERIAMAQLEVAKEEKEAGVYEPLEGEPSESNGTPTRWTESLYNYGTRSYQDRLWTAVFYLCVSLAVAGGIYGVVHRNPEYFKYDKDYMDDAKHCPLKPERFQLEEEGDEVVNLVANAWWLILSGILGSFVMGIVYIVLFRKHSHFMVNLTVNFQIALPAVFGIGLLFSGAFLPALGMLLLSGLFAFVFFMFRPQLELCSRLLTVTSAGLRDNPWIVFFVVILNLIMITLCMPLCIMFFVAFQNGSLIRNPSVVSIQGTKCFDKDGTSMPCCVFDNDPWVLPYAILAAFVLLWTIKLGFEIRLYTISGCISQWYFAPVGDTQVTKGSLSRSFRQAMGPSFGSLCLGSLVLTAAQVIQQIAEEARDSNSGNFVSYIVSSLASCMMELVKFLTRFATIRLSITGDKFCTAAHDAYDMLTRNLMSAYSVWWIPPMVLRMGAFVTSAIWGLACFLISWGLLAPGNKDGLTEAAIVGLISFGASMVVLAFFITLMVNIFEVVYFCYAMDRDARMISNPEVHEVYMLIPQKNNTGTVVEQPSGDIFYGAPQAVDRT